MEATEHAALVTLRGRHAHIEPRLEAVEAAARIVAQLVGPPGVLQEEDDTRGARRIDCFP